MAAPELEAELKATRAKLKRTRAQLAAAGYDLPPTVEATIAQARKEHLTYLKAEHLRSLAAVVLDVERRGLPGLIVEAGTARGGSAIVMAAAKSRARPLKVYDVFGMIPPPSEHDGPDVHERYARITAGDAQGVGGDTYYGYRDDLYEEVTESFGRLGVPVAEHNVELVRGLFDDTTRSRDELIAERMPNASVQCREVRGVFGLAQRSHALAKAGGSVQRGNNDGDHPPHASPSSSLRRARRSGRNGGG